jgi:transposase InsO family protein
MKVVKIFFKEPDYLHSTAPDDEDRPRRRRVARLHPHVGARCVRARAAILMDHGGAAKDAPPGIRARLQSRRLGRRAIEVPHGVKIVIGSVTGTGVPVLLFSDTALQLEAGTSQPLLSPNSSIAQQLNSYPRERHRICITTHTMSAMAITAMMAMVMPVFFVELELMVSTTTRRSA